MQDGEPFLAGTARPVVARMSAATAAQAGTADGGKVTVATARGSLTLPVEVAVMQDRVVWLPTRSAGSEIRRELAAYGHGLAGKPEVVGLNKIDAMASEDVARKCRALARAAGKGATVLPLSGVSGQGVPEIVNALLAAIDAAREDTLVEA